MRVSDALDGFTSAFNFFFKSPQEADKAPLGLGGERARVGDKGVHAVEVTEEGVVHYAKYLRQEKEFRKEEREIRLRQAEEGGILAGMRMEIRPYTGVGFGFSVGLSEIPSCKRGEE